MARTQARWAAQPRFARLEVTTSNRQFTLPRGADRFILWTPGATFTVNIRTDGVAAQNPTTATAETGGAVTVREGGTRLITGTPQVFEVQGGTDKLDIFSDTATQVIHMEYGESAGANA